MVIDDSEWRSVSTSEVITDEDEKGFTEKDWMIDKEKALREDRNARIYAERFQKDTGDDNKSKPGAYTEEEEKIIAAMGGKTNHPDRKRERGYLSDSTLEEIAHDYSVPICYIADVLCTWGVQPPINVQEVLGNLLTGEHAFSLLEAVNSLDVAALHDRYSNTNLLQLCYEWDIDIQEGFEMCMREKWNLPFGVQTCLRVEQEDELIRVLGNHLVMSREGDDDD